MDDEKYVFWEYNVVMILRGEVSKMFKRIKLSLRQHVYQETDVIIQRKIMPLLCEYYVTLHNYLEYLEKLSEDDNVVAIDGERKITHHGKNLIQSL